MKFTSILSTALLALSLAVEQISAQNTTQAIVPGVYQFISTVTDTNGNRLALTDQGNGNQIITSQLFYGQSNQLWTVRANFGSSTIFTIAAPSSGFVGPPLLNVYPGILSTVNTSTLWTSSFTPGIGFTFIDTFGGTTNWTLTGSTAGSGLNSLNSGSFVNSGFLSAFIPFRVS